MESSSNESFLWSDASNNSVIMSSGSETAQSEGDSQSKTRKKQKKCATIADNNNKIRIKNHREPKKRKQPESSDESQPEKKRIKSEPESDIDKRKQVKMSKATNDTNYESHNSMLNDEGYLNILVKQEQEYLISPEIVKLKKSKKCKKPYVNNFSETQSIVDLDKNGVECYLDTKVKEEEVSSTAPVVVKLKKKFKMSKSDIDLEMEAKPDLQASDSEIKDYLNLRVKQEQASVVDTNLITKNKKRKKRKRSASLSNENPMSSKYMHLNEIAVDNNSSEESEVEKRKKKNHKNDAHNIVSKESRDNIKGVSTEDSTDNTYNDTSFQPNDLTCNNVVSSTVINNSMIDTFNDTKKNITDSISSDLSRTNSNLHKMTNVSDRIRFEDDESKTSQKFDSRRISSKLKFFLKANPHLQIVPKTQNNCLVTEDDDIWIIRCPHDMNLKELKNTYLSLEGKCKIKINGQTYNGSRNDDLARVTFVTYQNGQASLANLAVKGCLNYRKRIPKTHIPDNISMINNQTNFIPLPDTKCRHPLFGSNYKKSLKIPAVVTERLQAAKERHEVSCENIIKHKSKKHKKREIDIKIAEELESEIEILKKKKKCKPSQGTPSASKKKKNIKHERHNTKAWESEKAIEENLFNF